MNMQRKNQANILARECMVAALMELLKEKPLSAITISELTQRAGVSRMTYYRNYQTKEDIFSFYLDDVLEQYREDSSNMPRTSTYFDIDNMVHYFSYLKKYEGFLESVFSSGLEHIFLQAITRYIMETWQKPGDSIEDYYTLQAFAGSLYTLYISWYKGGSKESPRTMAEILNRIYSDK